MLCHVWQIKAPGLPVTLTGFIKDKWKQQQHLMNFGLVEKAAVKISGRLDSSLQSGMFVGFWGIQTLFVNLICVLNCDWLNFDSTFTIPACQKGRVMESRPARQAQMFLGQHARVPTASADVKC